MRVWVEVFNLRGAFQGTIWNPISVAKGTALDAAGSIDISYSAGDAQANSLMKKERRCDIYVEQDGTTRLYGRGIIRDISANVADKTTLTASGPDTLDALGRKSVLLGRSYTNQSVYNIVTDLLSLADGGWFATVDSGAGSQTARFDGVSVLKALIRVAQEKGLHLREGMEINQLEVGAFGEDIGVIAMAPSPTHELNDNDNLIEITNLRLKSSSRDVVNWIIPQGAGEGTAALTLRDSTRGTINGDPYDIQSMTGPDGRTLYFLRDDLSADGDGTDDNPGYGEIQKIVSFKEIGPIANSSASKILAANALYDAAAAWLQRNSLALDTYSATVSKVRRSIRAGDQIRMKFKDLVESAALGTFTPVDVDDIFWVLKTKETLTESGLSLGLDFATVDRHEMDATQVVVGAIEAIEVRNVAVATFPFYYQDASERFIWGAGSSADRDAEWTLQFPDMMTEVLAVRFQFISRPPLATTDEYWGPVGTPPYSKYYNGFNGQLVTTLYPSQLSLFINGMDVTAALDPTGAWNRSGQNAALNITVDISSYILNASGGIFQTHTLRMKAGLYSGFLDHRVSTSYASTTSMNQSVGMIEGKFLVLGTGQAIKTN